MVDVNLLLAVLHPDTFYHEAGAIRHLSTVSLNPKQTLEEAVAAGLLKYRPGDGYYYDSTCWLPIRERLETRDGLVYSVEIGEHGYPVDWDRVETKLRVEFTYYRKPVKNLVPYKNVGPADLYKVITGPYFRKQTEHLRTLPTPAARREYKAAAFDYVTPAGVFPYREDKMITRRSGLLVLDYDHVPDPAALRELLLGDDQLTTVLAFISPSGDGLKQLVTVDMTHNHLTNFKAISNYLKHRYQIAVDPSGRNLSRPCFVCHDPTCYLNPDYAQ